MTNCFKKYLAFTLAETLIVMGVIGIVSALTLPNLNASTGEKEKIAKVKKMYQNLNDALGRAEAVYGPLENWKSLDNTEAAQATRFGERITEFMKVSKNCGVTTNQKCFSNSNVAYIGGYDYVYANSENPDGSGYVYKFVVADGTSVALYLDRILINIDGPKGKNRIGYDVFVFGSDIINNPFPSLSYNGSNILLTNPIQLLVTGNGITPAYWVINYDNMDYLKVKNGKCPNGTNFTHENPRCK